VFRKRKQGHPAATRRPSQEQYALTSRLRFEPRQVGHGRDWQETAFPAAAIYVALELFCCREPGLGAAPIYRSAIAKSMAAADIQNGFALILDPGKLAFSVANAESTLAHSRRIPRIEARKFSARSALHR
jgi:hypothetical protein